MIEEPNYIQVIADTLNIQQKQVEAVLNLVQEWATVPFIARYRKERTWNLDETQIRDILETKQKEENLFKAKNTALNWIEEKWKLTEELKNNILQAKTLKEVEEIYKPYKSKKKTKAMLAEEKWLKPVAELYKKENKLISKEELKSKLNVEDFEKIKDLEEDEIYAWVAEILSTEMVENTKLRDFLREEFLNNSNVVSKIKWEKAIDKLADNIKNEMYKFKIYEDFFTPIKKVKSYQILAINRWDNIWILSKKLEPIDEELETKFYEEWKKILWYNFQKIFEDKKLDASVSPYKKLTKSVENEVFGMINSKAQDDGIEIFQSNLFELLMTKPNYDKKILWIDPWYRTWCKLVILDKWWNPEKFDKIYLHKEDLAKKILWKYVKDVDIIVVGNGTWSNETVELLQDITDKEIYIVNESGASVYSASKVAQEEFPDLDLTDRWTVSIWRRYIDPLSELVKVPVGSIWVGMYQHDMPEKTLEEKLGYVVEDVVNKVWINVNTASIHLLKNVSWIDTRTAKKIYKNRPYSSREDLKKVLSEKVYEQAIWFLRVPNSSELLDNTDIHPEQYDLARFILSLNPDLEWNKTVTFGRTPNTVEQIAQNIFTKNKEKLVELYKDTTIQTVNFILNALKQAWKEVRENSSHKKATKKVSIDDLQEWDILEWIVRNIVQFWAFVDIGLKNDGLLHLSQIADAYVKDPADYLEIWQKVKVKVIWIDKEKGKTQLSMKNF